MAATPAAATVAELAAAARAAAVTVAAAGERLKFVVFIPSSRRFGLAADAASSLARPTRPRLGLAGLLCLELGHQPRPRDFSIED